MWSCQHHRGCWVKSFILTDTALSSGRVTRYVPCWIGFGVDHRGNAGSRSGHRSGKSRVASSFTASASWSRTGPVASGLILASSTAVALARGPVAPKNVVLAPLSLNEIFDGDGCGLARVLAHGRRRGLEGGREPRIDVSCAIPSSAAFLAASAKRVDVFITASGSVVVPWLVQRAGCSSVASIRLLVI